MDRRTALIGLTAAIGGGVTTRLGGVLTASPSHGTALVDELAIVRTAGTGPIRMVTIRPVPLGGGGFVTSLDQSADGKRFVCRTDVCNAYVRNIDDAAWRPLFSPSTMLPSDFEPLPEFNGKADGQGSAGVRIAPSNKDVIYASFYGYIWRSTDGGKSIRRTALPQKMMPSNAQLQRIFNSIIDVHPADANRLMVGTWGDGTWQSADGGKSWRRIELPPSLPMPPDNLPGISLVLFGHDPEHVYVFVGGVGLFASRTGAAGAFSAVPGGPSRCSSLVKSVDGAIHLCEYTGVSTGRLWRYHPERGWSSFDTPHDMISVTVDPHDPRRIWTTGPYGFGLITEDGGTTLTHRKLDSTRTGSEVGWIADLISLIVGQVLWDAGGGDNIWYATGVGVLKADIATRKITDWSAGIEELIGITGLSLPGGKTILTAWDKPIWPISDETSYGNSPTYPTDPGKAPLPDPISHGTSIDYASDDPRFLVGLVTSGGMFNSAYGPGFSTDGGDSWTRFTGTPAHLWAVGGCIAASTRENFILLPSNNGYGAYTHDGGRTWETLRLDGVKETSHFANAFYVKRKNIAADKTRKGVFALVYTVVQEGPQSMDNPLGGLWLTRDGGKSWKQLLRGVIGKGSHKPPDIPRGQDPRQYWACQLEYVPGYTSELIYTPHADDSDDRFWWSGDDGATWAELHNAIRNVDCFGFGKPAPGQTRPAVYFHGTVGGIKGIFGSFDWFATKPVLISRYPSQQLALIAAVVGDVNRFGRIWVGTGGAGWLRVDVDLATALPAA